MQQMDRIRKRFGVDPVNDVNALVNSKVLMPTTFYHQIEPIDLVNHWTKIDFRIIRVY